MPARKIIAKTLTAIAATGLLLLPALLVALAWTTINLKVALIAVSVCVLVAIKMPRWRWVSAIVASLLIAVPPYPYWLFSSEDRGWYLHFFHGYNLQNLPIAVFGVVFVLAMLLFAAIFWSIHRKTELSS